MGGGLRIDLASTRRTRCISFDVERSKGMDGPPGCQAGPSPVDRIVGGRDHIGEALQLGGKMFLAVLAERQEPLPLRFKDERDHLIDQRFARRGQLDPHRTPVLRFGKSRDQVQRFETVQSAGETGPTQKQ